MAEASPRVPVGEGREGGRGQCVVPRGLCSLYDSQRLFVVSSGARRRVISGDE